MVIPGAFYTPETLTGLVLAYMYNFEDQAKQQGESLRVPQFRAVGSLTENQQSLLNISLFQFNEDLSILSQTFLSSSRFPRFYYGSQAESQSSSAQEELTLTEGLSLDQEIRWTPVPESRQYLLASARVRHRKLLQVEADSRLQSEVNEAVRWARFGIAYESDQRDYITAPLQGSLLRTGVERVQFFGPRNGFWEFDLDYRKYLSVGPGAVVSLQGRLTLQEETQDKPFDQFLFLGGGNILPGIYEGRFRDSARAYVQGAYRFDFHKWSAATVFAGLGVVDRTFDELFRSPLRWAYGFGYHFFVDKASRTKARIELGFSESDYGLYVLFDEAF